MKRIAFLLVAGAILARAAVSTGTTSRHSTAQEAAPIFVTKIPPGYRDWKVVSVAHEEGDLNDIRPSPVFRGRRPHGVLSAGHGQGLNEVRRDRLLGVGVF